MRKNAVATIVIALLCSLTWWNYAAFSWEYRHRKLQFRNWYWRHFGDPFEVQARAIAGRKALDCSNSPQGETAFSTCMSEARREGRGFRLQYPTRGIDTTGVEGIIGSKDGPTFELSYILWNEYVTVSKRRCPEPLQLAVNADDRPYCFPSIKSENEIEVLRDDWAQHVNRAK